MFQVYEQHFKQFGRFRVIRGSKQTEVFYSKNRAKIFIHSSKKKLFFELFRYLKILFFKIECYLLFRNF